MHGNLCDYSQKSEESLENFPPRSVSHLKRTADQRSVSGIPCQRGRRGVLLPGRRPCLRDAALPLAVTRPGGQQRRSVLPSVPTALAETLPTMTNRLLGREAHKCHGVNARAALTMTARLPWQQLSHPKDYCYSAPVHHSVAGFCPLD